MIDYLGRINVPFSPTRSFKTDTTMVLFQRVVEALSSRGNVSTEKSVIAAIRAEVYKGYVERGFVGMENMPPPVLVTNGGMLNVQRNTTEFDPNKIYTIKDGQIFETEIEED